MNTIVPCAYALPYERVFPIQRLHPEILAEIFKFCLSTNYAGINHAPLLLCNICSSWRALAISTPRLWTDLNLRYESLLDSDIPPIVHGIHTWLGRSRVLPLTIQFRCLESGERIDKIMHVCNALSMYASRWKNVDVAVPSIILSSWPDVPAVPLLRTLRIRSILYRTIFTSAPCLEKLHLFSAPYTFAAPYTDIPHFPWNQLVELAFTKWEEDEKILRLISWCPVLESIEARISPISPFRLSRLSPVEHVNLRNIKFCFEHDQYTILESLVVPGLKSLSLCDDTPIENRSWPRIYSNPLGLVNRSNCELQNLHLVRFFFNNHGLIKFLQHKGCQTLTSLRSENYGHSQNVFDEHLLRLTHVDGKEEDVLCPELTHLTLTYCYPGNTSAGVLGRMILSRSRRTERSRLRSFELFIAPSSDFAEADQVLLKRAEENGLKSCINNFIKWKCWRDE